MNRPAPASGVAAAATSFTSQLDGQSSSAKYVSINAQPQRLESFGSIGNMPPRTSASNPHSGEELTSIMCVFQSCALPYAVGVSTAPPKVRHCPSRSAT